MRINAASQTQFTLPPFTQGNVLPVQVQILEPNPDGGANSFSLTNISNIALSAAMLAAPTGASVDAPFMTAYSWTKDLVNGIFTANFDFTSASVDSFIGTATDKQAFLEFIATEGTSRYSIWSGLVKIKATGIKNTSVVPVPGQVALSLAQAQQMFVPFLMGAAQTITFVSPDGTHERILGVHDDATAQDDII